MLHRVQIQSIRTREPTSPSVVVKSNRIKSPSPRLLPIFKCVACCYPAPFLFLDNYSFNLSFAVQGHAATHRNMGRRHTWFLCIVALALPPAHASEYQTIGNGWCRDDAGKLLPYITSWSVTSTDACRGVCTSLSTCAGYAYLSPQCVVSVASALSDVASGWKQMAGTGATDITTSTGMSGPVCYKKGAAPDDSMNEGPTSNGTDSTDTPGGWIIYTAQPAGADTPANATSDVPGGAADAAWDSPLLSCIVALSLLVSLFSVGASLYEHRQAVAAELRLLFGSVDSSVPPVAQRPDPASNNLHLFDEMQLFRKLVGAAPAPAAVASRSSALHQQYPHSGNYVPSMQSQYLQPVPADEVAS